MKDSLGVVLVMALVFLLAMTLLVLAMFSVSQLSLKAAQAGQQHLQITQLGLLRHLQQEVGAADAVLQHMTDCPAQYAAWSAGNIKCDLQLISTDTYSANRHFYAGYHSLYVQQQLPLPEN